jgi:hypothetical protein
MIESLEECKYKKIPRAFLYVADNNGRLHYSDVGSLLDTYGIKPKVANIQVDKEDKIRRTENLNIENQS